MTLPELRGLAARKLVRALERDGFRCRRIHGSHHVAFHSLGATFPTGTLRSIFRATGWTTVQVVLLGLLRTQPPEVRP